jgi:hypothetical protein
MILNASYVGLHVFSLRRESPNSDPGRQTHHFWGDSITQTALTESAGKPSPETSILVGIPKKSIGITGLPITLLIYRPWLVFTFLSVICRATVRLLWFYGSGVWFTIVRLRFTKVTSTGHFAYTSLFIFLLDMFRVSNFVTNTLIGCLCSLYSLCSFCRSCILCSYRCLCSLCCFRYLSMFLMFFLIWIVVDGGPANYWLGLVAWAERGCVLYMQLLWMYKDRWQSNMVQATFGHTWIQCEALF